MADHKDDLALSARIDLKSPGEVWTLFSDKSGHYLTTTTFGNRLSKNNMCHRGLLQSVSLRRLVKWRVQGER